MKWNEQIRCTCRIHSEELRCGHSGDHKRHPVEENRLPDCISASRKTPPPVVAADHYGWRGAAAVVKIADQASGSGTHAEAAEEVARHKLPVHKIGLSLNTQIQPTRIGESKHAG